MITLINHSSTSTHIEIEEFEGTISELVTFLLFEEWPSIFEYRSESYITFHTINTDDYITAYIPNL